MAPLFIIGWKQFLIDDCKFSGEDTSQALWKVNNLTAGLKAVLLWDS